MIFTGENVFTNDNTGSRKILRERSQGLSNEMSGQNVYAYVNHSRWVVDCPCCNTGSLYFEDHKFYCLRCRNELTGGKLYHVVMPKDRKKIEGILQYRAWKNRNWERGESIEDLKKENKDHGLEYPEDLD